MQKVFEEVQDDRLRVYIVWLPVIPGDSRGWAETRTREFSDDRLRYFWDGGQITGEVWQSVLDINTIAWDVYFLYGADTHWGEAPSVPAFWMHQLRIDTKQALKLDAKFFAKKTKELLR